MQGSDAVGKDWVGRLLPALLWIGIFLYLPVSKIKCPEMQMRKTSASSVVTAEIQIFCSYTEDANSLLLQRRCKFFVVTAKMQILGNMLRVCFSLLVTVSSKTNTLVILLVLCRKYKKIKTNCKIFRYRLYELFLYYIDSDKQKYKT